MSIIVRPKDPEYSSSLVEIKLYDAVPPCEGREIETIFGKTIDFATLVEKFEEVKKEPLIKDEKIRKAVRAWADNLREVMCDGEITFYIDKAFCTFQTSVWKGYETRDIAELDLVFDYAGLYDSKIYTIAELCGEDEE